jgi:hypothetical protein
MRALLTAAVVLTAALVLAAPAFARPTTKRQAELNLLRATRVLAHWRLAAVDPRTGTLRSNTAVSCAGRGTAISIRSGALAYRSFLCRLSHGTERARILYLTKPGRAFALRLLSRQVVRSGKGTA